MSKNYWEVFSEAKEAYLKACEEGIINNYEEPARKVLRNLTKEELREMNEELELTLLFSHETKEKWIESMVLFGIRLPHEIDIIDEVLDDYYKK